MSHSLDHDFSRVRIHRNAQADQLAGDLQARAFTVGPHIFFRDGKFRPDTSAGQHLIAHELVHVMQQERMPSHSPQVPVQRAVDFDKASAEATAKVVDDNHEVSDSMELFWEFVSGLSEFLGFNYVRDPDDVYRIVELVDNSDASSLESKISARFANPIRVQKAKGGFETVDQSKALEIWRKTREEVKQHVADGFDVHEDRRKLLAGAMAEKGGDVHVRPDWVRSTHIRKSSGWNLFWILLHEILHVAGRNDALEGSGMYQSPQSGDREISMRGETKIESVTYIGDIEYRLNVIRIGLGLPVRTNYSDAPPSGSNATAVFFSDSPGEGRSEYVGGVFINPSLDAVSQLHEASDLLVAKDYDSKAAVAASRDKKARSKGAILAPGLEVSKLAFADGEESITIAEPGAIQIVVTPSGDVAVSGKYEYTKASGQHRFGVVSGGYFTYDASVSAVHLVFDWVETAADNWVRKGKADLALSHDEAKRLGYFSVRLVGTWSTDDDRAASWMEMTATRRQESP